MAAWRKLSPHRSVRVGWPLYWCIQLAETNTWAQKWNAFRLSLRPLKPELSLLEGLEIDQSIFTRRDQLHWTLDLVLRYVVELSETNVWMSCLSSYDLSSPGTPIWPRVIESITVTAHWMAGWRKLSPHRSVRVGWPLYSCVQLTETNRWVCVTPLNDTPVRMKTAPTFRIRVSPLGVAQKWNTQPCVRLREQIDNLFSVCPYTP